MSFESREYFHRSASAVFKNGCALHPINSTLICYVNAHTLRLNKPGGVSGLVCLIFVSILAGIAVIAGLVWIGIIVVEQITRPIAVTTLPAPTHAQMKEDE